MLYLNMRQIFDRRSSLGLVLLIVADSSISPVHLSIAHKWAQAPGLQSHPQWAMCPVFKAQPNPQPINRRLSKAHQKPISIHEYSLGTYKVAD
ncbi:hypothetical protein VN97_g3818 [Penicillium thymicola]|uniref:Uncharacterized protein n=1 Tax=Penicillium thymicola TaxID=293382 RepID=A0AAI9TLU6_PENTH|nr:hypothetical protein VN97_g3818 [Penicillium thymicola]